MRVSDEQKDGRAAAGLCCLGITRGQCRKRRKGPGWSFTYRRQWRREVHNLRLGGSIVSQARSPDGSQEPERVVRGKLRFLVERPLLRAAMRTIAKAHQASRHSPIANPSIRIESVGTNPAASRSTLTIRISISSNGPATMRSDRPLSCSFGCENQNDQQE